MLRKVKVCGLDTDPISDTGQVEGGFLDFEVALAVKEMMGKVGRLGRVLGPRGLMPNPRTNTVVEAHDEVVQLAVRHALEAEEIIAALKPIVISTTPRENAYSLKKYVSDDNMKNVTNSPTIERRTLGLCSTYSPTEMNDNNATADTTMNTIGYA
jgi:hypothetical protein